MKANVKIKVFINHESVLNLLLNLDFKIHLYADFYTVYPIVKENQKEYIIIHDNGFCLGKIEEYTNNFKRNAFYTYIYLSTLVKEYNKPNKIVIAALSKDIYREEEITELSNNYLYREYTESFANPNFIKLQDLYSFLLEYHNGTYDTFFDNTDKSYHLIDIKVP